MNTAQARNAYKQTESHAQIHPVKLIHLIYERILTHLDEADRGLLDKNFMICGENLGRAIALITELNASIKDGDNSEAADFLRGIYSAILLELPKATIAKDVEIIRQAYRYIRELKSIWEKTALAEAGFSAEKGSASKQKAAVAPLEACQPGEKSKQTVAEQPVVNRKYGASGKKIAAYAQHAALSVSI